jgi:hypothetical protein
MQLDFEDRRPMPVQEQRSGVRLWLAEQAENIARRLRRTDA